MNLNIIRIRVFPNIINIGVCACMYMHEFQYNLCVCQHDVYVFMCVYVDITSMWVYVSACMNTNIYVCANIIDICVCVSICV